MTKELNGLTLHPDHKLFMQELRRLGKLNEKFTTKQLRPAKALIALKDHYAMLEDFSKKAGKHTSCYGCTTGSCCYQGVTLSPADVKRIEDRYGIKHNPDGFVSFEDFENRPIPEASFSDPCVFLKDNRCSIYDARPGPCLCHFNLTDTQKTCDDISEGQGARIDTSALAGVNLLLSKMAKFPTVCGDIRDLFPNGLSSV